MKLFSEYVHYSDLKLIKEMCKYLNLSIYGVVLVIFLFHAFLVFFNFERFVVVAGDPLFDS